MRMFLFTFLLMVFIFLLADVASYVTRSNGIPDVFAVLFPDKYVNKEDQRALKTGVVPFADGNAAPEIATPQQVYSAPGAENLAPKNIDTESMYDPLGESVVVSQQLDMPHRNEAAVNDWVTEAVGAVLTFSLPEYQDHLRDISKYMAGNGMEEFKKFLEDTKVLGLMQTRGFTLKTFVTNVPTLVASGVAQGRYRWVYDVPLDLTFLPVGMQDYDKLKKDDYVSETLTVRVQLGRVPILNKPGENKDTTPSGLLANESIEIETWEVLPKQVPDEAK